MSKSRVMPLASAFIAPVDALPSASVPEPSKPPVMGPIWMLPESFIPARSAAAMSSSAIALAGSANDPFVLIESITRLPATL